MTAHPSSSRPSRHRPTAIATALALATAAWLLPIFSPPPPAPAPPRLEPRATRFNQGFLNPLVPIAFVGQTIDRVRLPPGRRWIALTFDDGPWPAQTEAVLSLLRREQIKATFFWVGQNVANFPAVARRVVAEGHAIGNHTWRHSFAQLDPVSARVEIERTAEVIATQTGVTTRLFRPPGGLLHNGPAAVAAQEGYAVLLWSADSTDYVPQASVETLVRRTIAQASPGGLVLLHDGGGNRSRTLAALPKIIAQLRSQGYEFVTVPDLLAAQTGAIVPFRGLVRPPR